MIDQAAGSPAVSNVILWENSAFVSGDEIHVNQGSIEVAWSDVQGGWAGTGNIDADPLFVSGPGGDFYLSQIDAGQAADSPCVDAGDALLPLVPGTTRTDEVPDEDTVDMGYHFPI